jgi:hypothetical protein
MLALVAGVGLAYLLLSSPDSTYKSTALQFRALPVSDEKVDETVALASLSVTSARFKEVATGRIEQPFWLLSEPITNGSHAQRAFFIPSRHTQRLTAWVLNETGEVVASGSAERGVAPTGVRQSRAGYSIDIPVGTPAPRVLLRVKSSGPARLSVEY